MTPDGTVTALLDLTLTAPTWVIATDLDQMMYEFLSSH